MSFFRTLFRSRRFRIFLIWAAGCLLALGIADYRWETHGVPEALVRMIQREFAAHGLRFEAGEIRAGVCGGIVLRDLTVDGGRELPSLAAAELRMDISPSKFFQGIFLPVTFELKHGTVSFPLFPEYGEEAACDNLVISGVNASVTGEPGLLRVRRAEGSLNGIRFSMTGSIDNLLHYSGLRGMESVRGLFAAEKRSGGGEETVVRERTTQYVGFLKRIPLELRRKALYAIQRMNEKRFALTPACRLDFHIDITDFEKCLANASLRIPAFSYGNLKIESIEERMVLKNGILSLENVRVVLPDGSAIDARGVYDGSGRVAHGSVKGRCHLEDILLFLDDSLRDGIAKHVRYAGEDVTFEGVLDRFNPSGGVLAGSLHFFLPHIVIAGVELSNASATVRTEGDVLSGTLHSADLMGGGSLSGRFQVKDGRFSSELNGRVLPAEMRHFLSGDVADFIYSNIRFRDAKSLVSFSGSLNSSVRDIRALSGRFQIRIPELRVKSVPVKTMRAVLEFNSGGIRVSGMEAGLADGARISGDLFCLPSEHSLSASLVCSGSPQSIIAALGEEHQDFVKSLTRNIGWPSAGNYVEAAAELHVDYGRNPFYYMTGSIVGRDFSYQQIPFRYGAARFIIDADNNLILPDAVLETKDGRMSVSATYVPATRSVPFRNPSGRLNFSLVSTMAGNDMIRSLYPQWKSEFIDFPHPIKVESTGVIDYENPGRTQFDAVISNGFCEWHQMGIQDIDAILKYKGGRLSFRNASANFSGGRLLMDYLYNFRTKRGTIAARLSGANMQSVLENFSRKKTSPEYRNGRLSADFRAQMSYSGKEELLLNGDGRLELSGDNLWTVPLLGSFLRIIGQAWSLDSFGSITKVSCDYKLIGDRLVFDQLKSDGGFVSLDASGYYRWADNHFDIRVRAELLKSALPFDVMSRLLTPVSWILDKRLKGDFNTFNWE